MSDPTLGLTYDDFRIRVAEFLGVAYYGPNGDQAAQLPVDAHDLDLVSRIVNDGYRRFIGENEKWNFLNVPFTLQFVTGTAGRRRAAAPRPSWIPASRRRSDSFFNGFTPPRHARRGSVDIVHVTAYTGATHTFTFSAGNSSRRRGHATQLAASTAVEGQNYRYYLPDDFYGILMTPLHLRRGRASPDPINEVDEGRPSGNCGPVPTPAARLRPWPSVLLTRRLPRPQTVGGSVLAPPPGVERMTATYKRFPQKLSSGTDRSVAGYQHDDTAIMAACVAEAERQRGDAIGPREQAYQAMLERAMKLDARASEARAKEFGDRSEDRAPFGRRPLNFYGVSTYNGSTIP
jgi:hypothetical protein